MCVCVCVSCVVAVCMCMFISLPHTHSDTQYRFDLRTRFVTWVGEFGSATLSLSDKFSCSARF
jgi:hypothetical protein